MPHLDEDLSEGLKISQSIAGLVLTRTFFASEMTGDNPTDKLAKALTLTATGLGHTGANLPEIYDSFVAGGRTFYCKDRDADPWPPLDAVITCRYDTDPPPVAGFGPVQVEVGSSLEMSETDYDFAQLQQPFLARVPLIVYPPGAIEGDPQGIRVPIFVPKPCLILTRQESSSPEPRADGWVGWTNSDTFRSYAPDTCLMLEIRGRNAGDGIWNTTYWIARDPINKWKQVGRWRNPDGTYPSFDAADVAQNGGARLVTVQGSKPYGPLSLG